MSEITFQEPEKISYVEMEKLRSLEANIKEINKKLEKISILPRMLRIEHGIIEASDGGLYDVVFSKPFFKPPVIIAMLKFSAKIPSIVGKTIKYPRAGVLSKKKISYEDISPGVVSSPSKISVSKLIVVKTPQKLPPKKAISSIMKRIDIDAIAPKDIDTEKITKEAISGLSTISPPASVGVSRYSQSERQKYISAIESNFVSKYWSYRAFDEVRRDIINAIVASMDISIDRAIRNVEEVWSNTIRPAIILAGKAMSNNIAMVVRRLVSMIKQLYLDVQNRDNQQNTKIRNAINSHIADAEAKINEIAKDILSAYDEYIQDMMHIIVNSLNYAIKTNMMTLTEEINKTLKSHTSNINAAFSFMAADINKKTKNSMISIQEAINDIYDKIPQVVNSIVAELSKEINISLLDIAEKINASLKAAVLGLTDMGYSTSYVEVTGLTTDRATLKVSHPGKVFWVAIGYAR